MADITPAVDIFKSAWETANAMGQHGHRTEEALAAVFDDLVSQADIARLYGVGRSTPPMWYARRDKTGFPEPVIDLGQTKLWSRIAVKAWKEAS